MLLQSTLCSGQETQPAAERQQRAARLLAERLRRSALPAVWAATFILLWNVDQLPLCGLWRLERCGDLG